MNDVIQRRSLRSHIFCWSHCWSAIQPPWRCAWQSVLDGTHMLWCCIMIAIVTLCLTVLLVLCAVASNLSWTESCLHSQLSFCLSRLSSSLVNAPSFQPVCINVCMAAANTGLSSRSSTVNAAKFHFAQTLMHARARLASLSVTDIYMAWVIYVCAAKILLKLCLVMTCLDNVWESACHALIAMSSTTSWPASSHNFDPQAVAVMPFPSSRSPWLTRRHHI